MYVLMWDLVYKIHKLNRKKCIQLTYIVMHKIHVHTPISNINQLPQYTTCVISHIHPQLVLQLSILIQITLLTPLTSFPMPTSSHNLQVFFKVTCHICCGIYIFLNKLTCVKLCHHFFLGGSIFFQIGAFLRVNIFSIVPYSLFPISLVAFVT